MRIKLDIRRRLRDLRPLSLHRSTVILALMTLVILVLLNVPGEIVSPLGGHFGGYTASYESGWPFIHQQRAVKYVFSNPGPTFPDIPWYGVPWLAWDSWKFWRGDEMRIHPLALLANLAIALSLFLLVVVGWERRRRKARLFQFRIAHLFLATTCVAVVLGWWSCTIRECVREAPHVDALWDLGATIDENYAGPLWPKRLIGPSPRLEKFSRAEAVYFDDWGGINNDQLAETIPHLQSLKRLRYLNICPSDGVAIRYSQLASLSGLRFLELGTLLTESEVEELAALTQLREISLWAMEEQDPEIIRTLIQRLPNCRVTHGSTYHDIFTGW